MCNKEDHYHCHVYSWSPCNPKEPGHQIESSFVICGANLSSIASDSKSERFTTANSDLWHSSRFLTDRHSYMACVQTRVYMEQNSLFKSTILQVVHHVSLVHFNFETKDVIDLDHSRTLKIQHGAVDLRRL